MASSRNLYATERAVIRNFGWGSGVTEVGSTCREVTLPEPDFEQRGGQWVVTLWRDWLTAEVLAKLELNDRQKQVIDYLKVKREIANRDYQTLTGTISRTALRDLRELMAFGLVDKIGKTGRSTH